MLRYDRESREIQPKQKSSPLTARKHLNKEKPSNQAFFVE